MSSWRTELSAQASLAAPVIAVNLAMMAMGVVDTQMAGHLSTTALAAIGLGHAWVWCPLSFGMGVVMALDPLVAQARGARDEPAVARALQRGLLMALFVSVPVAALSLAARWVFESLGAVDLGQLMGLGAPGATAVGPMVPSGVIPDAADYARISAIGVPGMLVFLALRQSLQALGHLRAILLVAVSANLVNVLFNWLLMYGHWGLPRLGVLGCAWATVIVEIFMVVVLLIVTRPVVAPYLWPIRRQALQWRPFVRMLALGAPIGLAIALEGGAFNGIQFLMGSFGETVMAGHRTAIILASVSFMVPLGISTAAAVRVGHAVGAGDRAGVRLAANVALAAGALTMMGFGVTFVTWPRELAMIFTPDLDVIAVTATLMPLAGAFQLFDGVQVVAAGVLRGTADTRWPSVLNFIGYWVLGMPAGIWWAFRLDKGPSALWWGLAGGLAFVALALLWRVSRRLSQVIARVDLETAGQAG